MFDNLKGMASVAGIMKDLPRLKAKMEEVKERLATITVDAETGGGAVCVVANAQLRVVSIRVDPAMLAGLIDPDNTDDHIIAEELIVGAVNAAMEKAREAAAREMTDAAASMGIALPPGALGGLI